MSPNCDKDISHASHRRLPKSGLVEAVAVLDCCPGVEDVEFAAADQVEKLLALRFRHDHNDHHGLFRLLKEA